MTIERLDHADGVARSYIRATTLGRVVYPCGQIPTRPDGSTPEGIGQQTTVCLDNLERVLVRAGSGLGSLLQVTVYLADQGDFDEYDRAWRERLAEVALPPRTTVFVSGFRGEKRIELTAVAALEEVSND